MSSCSKYPDYWKTSKIGDTFQVIGGGTPSTKEPDYWNGTIPWITSADILGLNNITPRKFISMRAIQESATNLVPKNSIILVSRVNVGRIALSETELCFSQDCQALIPKDNNIEPKFALYYIWHVAELLKSESRGTTISGITKSVIKDLEIPIPPREEQQRIVTQIEKLLARVEAAKERLHRVPAIMQQFRQSVLAAACSGKLTEDWRENNSISEPFPVTNGKFSFKFIFHEPTPLPSLWYYEALGNLGQWKGGGTPSTNNSQYWENGSIPWTSPKDMKSEIITDSKDHITTLAIQEKKLPLIPTNAIIFVVRGLILAHSFPVAITDCQTVINQDMRGLIPEKIYPKFLLRTLQNEKNNILNIVRSSTHGTKRIESDTLKLWPIPIPPLEEQKEICRRIEALFTHANKIESEIASTRELVETINQSILHQAFTGKLVSQESKTI